MIACCQTQFGYCNRFLQNAQSSMQSGCQAAAPGGVPRLQTSGPTEPTCSSFLLASKHGAGRKMDSRRWENRTLGSSRQVMDRKRVGVVRMGIKAIENYNTDFELDSVVRNCLLGKFTFASAEATFSHNGRYLMRHPQSDTKVWSTILTFGHCNCEHTNPNTTTTTCTLSGPFL